MVSNQFSTPQKANRSKASMGDISLDLSPPTFAYASSKIPCYHPSNACVSLPLNEPSFRTPILNAECKFVPIFASSPSVKRKNRKMKTRPTILKPAPRSHKYRHTRILSRKNRISVTRRLINMAKSGHNIGWTSRGSTWGSG